MYFLNFFWFLSFVLSAVRIRRPHPHFTESPFSVFPQFSKNSGGWENSRKLCKPTTASRVAFFSDKPCSIYQYSSMAPRLSGQNCNFFEVSFVPQFPKEV